MKKMCSVWVPGCSRGFALALIENDNHYRLAGRPESPAPGADPEPAGRLPPQRLGPNQQPAAIRPQAGDMDVVRMIDFVEGLLALAMVLGPIVAVVLMIRR